MKRIGGLLEGLLLLAMGLYMSGLCWVGDYGFFMNPKFKWLTAIAAVGLLILGVSALIRPNRRPSFSNIVVFVFLIGLFAMELDAALYPPSPDSVGGGDVERAKEAQAQQTLSYNGLDYTKINLAELNILCESDRQDRMSAAYVVRGVVKKNDILESRREFSLIRITVFCCLADSIGMGFRVKYDDLAHLKDGQWVNVYGRLEREPITQDALTSVQQNGKFFTALQENYILVADRVEKIDPPEVAYIFEFNDEPPYAY